MTENEARNILRARLEKRCRQGEEIWIGAARSHGNLGYSFRAGIFRPENGRPTNFTVWAVDANTKKAELMLLQHAD